MRILAFLTLLAAEPVAQQVTVPAIAAVMLEPNAGQEWWTISPSARTQLVYDVREIAPTTATWSSLQLRAAGGLYTVAVSLTLAIGVSPQQYSGMSLQTANANLGPNPTIVFSGLVAPASSSKGWVTCCPFAVPFSYVSTGGKTLVLDFMKGYASGYWAVEQWSPDLGSFATYLPNQATCKFSSGRWAVSVPAATPYLGSDWYTSYLNVPPGSLGALTLGLSGPAPATRPGAVWCTGLRLDRHVGLHARGRDECPWRRGQSAGICAAPAEPARQHVL